MSSVYEDLGVTPIINAAGTLTRLSGSTMWPEAVDAMAAASRHFVDMQELHEAAGRRLAELIGVGAAHVCACATAGIATMAAATMAGRDGARVRQLPDTTGMDDRFVALKAHRNSFDQALRVAGGSFIEVEADREKVASALAQERVAAFFYTFSWFNTDVELDLPSVIEMAHAAGKPVLVDAAAEVPPLANLRRFVDEGADLVTFSGGKALRGPQSSGLILGRADLVAACAANDSPNMSIGRGMKTAKEDIVGLVKAVELYVSRDHDADMRVWEGRVQTIVSAVADIEGVRARRQLPKGLGQKIPHAAVSWDEAMLGREYAAVAAQLKEGPPRIAVQLIDEGVYASARQTGWELRLHPHTLREGEEVVVARRLRLSLLGNTG